jgi:hypothetical protein
MERLLDWLKKQQQKQYVMLCWGFNMQTHSITEVTAQEEQVQAKPFWRT